jgi:hypothetical protein
MRPARRRAPRRAVPRPTAHDERTWDDPVRRRPRALSRSEVVIFGLPSLALGVAPLVWPGRTSRLIGVENSSVTRAMLRAIGVRELVVAVLFLQRGTPPWLWGFVAQDAIDLPLCTALMLRRRQADHRRFSITYGAYLTLGAIDTYAAMTRNTTRQKSCA